MAAAEVVVMERPESRETPAPPPSGLSTHFHCKDLLSSYLGISFAVFLGLLPRASISYFCSLQSRARSLSLQLLHAEEQIRQMRSRRKEDSKANARVVEIFASHRNGWQQEERRLLSQIDASNEEITGLKARVSELEKSEAELKEAVERLKMEVSEREEMIDFMSRKVEEDDGGSVGEELVEKEVEMGGGGSCGKDLEESGGASGGGFGDYGCVDYPGIGGKVGVIPEGVMSAAPEFCFVDNSGELVDEMAAMYMQQNDFGRELFSSASKGWTDRSNGWQDMQYESLESLYPTKNFVARRESPWKVDGESSGVSSKLKLLELELVNLEKIGNGDLLKVPSLLRKQAKKYQSLAGKIDDLCRRMQISDPSEPSLSLEFRTQRQTEFLLEAFRLQHRATETGQKLTALQAETASSCIGDELNLQAKLTTKKSLESIRNNFKEIQRNLEIWLARIMGDLEGILAREGTSRVRDYYISRYPFVK